MNSNTYGEGCPGLAPVPPPAAAVAADTLQCLSEGNTFCSVAREKVLQTDDMLVWLLSGNACSSKIAF